MDPIRKTTSNIGGKGHKNPAGKLSSSLSTGESDKIRDKVDVGPYLPALRAPHAHLAEILPRIASELECVEGVA